MTNLRTVLADFVRWGWVVQLLVLYFMALVWWVLDWFMHLKEPTAIQASVIGLVIGILPGLGTLFALTISRISPPPQ